FDGRRVGLPRRLPGSVDRPDLLAPVPHGPDGRGLATRRLPSDSERLPRRIPGAGAAAAALRITAVRRTPPGRRATVATPLVALAGTAARDAVRERSRQLSAFPAHR